MLEGKRCLITGATGGLGMELARTFGMLGCRLLLAGRTDQGLDQLRSRLRHSTGVEGYLAADLGRQEDVDRLIRQVEAIVGGLDVLVNNAGLFPVGPFDTLAKEDLNQCLDVNLRSAMRLAQAFAPPMAKAGWGRVVNIASSSAYAGFANTVAYCASKHGLLGFSRALDDELRASGVRVIAVSPGSIKTPMGRKVPGQTYETFIDPREAAELIGKIVSLDGSIAVNELRIGRMVMG